MLFHNTDHIKVAGFTGCRKIRDLWVDSSDVPRAKGVYFVLYTGEGMPEFVEKGTGGVYKDRDPNVPVRELEKSWIEDTLVIYVGAAGGRSRLEGKQSKDTLQTRIRRLLRFGRGENVGHWSGRYIWQIRNPGELVICWKKLFEKDPGDVKADVLQTFETIYHYPPFGNRADIKERYGETA